VYYKKEENSLTRAISSGKMLY